MMIYTNKNDNNVAGYAETFPVYEENKEKWTKKAEQEKIEDPNGGGKRKKTETDPNAAKSNTIAYFLFSVCIRPTVTRENPEASFSDMARIISAKYKALGDTERKAWDAKAVLYVNQINQK